MLSTLCHFHGLLFARAMLNLQLHRPAQWAVLTREVFVATGVMSVLAILHTSRRGYCAVSLAESDNTVGGHPAWSLAFKEIDPWLVQPTLARDADMLCWTKCFEQV
jgi:hypothetical protein